MIPITPGFNYLWMLYKFQEGQKEIGQGLNNTVLRLIPNIY